MACGFPGLGGGNEGSISGMPVLRHPGISSPIFPISAIMRELNGDFFVGSQRGCLGDIDVVSMDCEFAVVVVGGEVLLEKVAV